MLKNVEVIQFASPQLLARSAAEKLLESIDDRAQAHRTLSLALSGGRIAATFFDAVVEEGYETDTTVVENRHCRVNEILRSLVAVPNIL